MASKCKCAALLFRSWRCRHDSTASPPKAAWPLVWPLIPPFSSSTRSNRAASLCLTAQEEPPPKTSSVWVWQPWENLCQPPSCRHPPRTPLPVSPSAAPWTWAAWASRSWTTAPPQRSTPTWAWETFLWTTGAPCLQRGWPSRCFLLCHQVPLKPAVAGAALIWTRTCDEFCVAVRDCL